MEVRELLYIKLCDFAYGRILKTAMQDLQDFPPEEQVSLCLLNLLKCFWAMHILSS